MQPSKYQVGVFNGVKELVGRSTGAIAVEAKAGSGKTTTNVKSLEYVPSSMKVLEVAFNKSIAEELQRRVPAHVDAKTLNGLGNGVLAKGLGRRPNLDIDKTFNICKAILDEKDCRFMAGAIRRVVSLLKGKAIVRNIYKEEIITLMDEYDIDFNGNMDKFYTALCEVWTVSKSHHSDIDFDDQLFLPIYLGFPFPKYDLLMGDEAQDWNPVQMLMIQQCADRIVFFGDTNQAIYGFRGADPYAMKNFVERLNATTLPLSICYRCGKAIVRQAQKYVPEIEWSDTAPEGVVDRLSKDTFRKKAETNDFVLCRTTAPLVSSCLKFIAEERLATVKGRDIGVGLVALMDRIAIGILPTREFVDTLTKYQTLEIGKLEAANRHTKIQTLMDQCETLMVFAERCADTLEIKQSIQRIFSDKATGIQHMTIHRSKGLETPRVFIIEPKKGIKVTKAWQEQQEVNLKYVACTRAQHELYYTEE